MALFDCLERRFAYDFGRPIFTAVIPISVSMAATALDVSLDPSKTLKSLTMRTLSNDMVIGLMSLSLERP